MRVKHRSPTMRLIILAAFVLAAGLFALRVYDHFGSANSEPVGGALEQELTYLLEPITGPNRVRVSVTGSAPKSVLVMIDGDMATDLRPLRTRIETILAAAMAFDPERDALTISQFPFARGVGASLSAIEMAELTGLGLLAALLLAGILAPVPRQPVVPTARAAPDPYRGTQPPAAPATSTPARLTASNDDTRQDLQTASALAETKPDETATLVRNWMSYAEE